jgi:hypothetical protein
MTDIHILRSMLLNNSQYRQHISYKFHRQLPELIFEYTILMRLLGTVLDSNMHRRRFHHHQKLQT